MPTIRIHEKPSITTLVAGYKIPVDHATNGLRQIDGGDLLNQIETLIAEQAPGASGGMTYENVANLAARNALTVTTEQIAKRLVKTVDTGVIYIAIGAGTGAGVWEVFVEAAPGAEDSTNLLTYGADPTGVADSLPALVAALAASDFVLVPSGEFRLSAAVTIPSGKLVLGYGRDKTTFKSYSTGKAITTSAESRNIQLSRFALTNGGGAANLIGIELVQSRHARLEGLAIYDFSAAGAAAIKIDGKDTFAASNFIEDPLLGRNYRGIWLTANNGFQCNHTQIFGGYIYGSGPIHAMADSAGVFIERGDTNYIFGTAVEDYAVGWDLQAVDAGGVTLVSPRTENCTAKYRINPNANNVVIVAPVDDLDENTFGGSGDGAISISKIPYLRLDKAYLANSKFLRGKSSDGVRWDLVGVNGTNHLEIWTPTYDVAKGIRFMCRGDGTTLGTLSKAGMNLEVPFAARTSINFQTGTTYTLVRADENICVSLVNAGAITLSVPQNSDVGFPVGTTITLRQGGAGQVTVAGLGAATVNGRGGALKLSGQYAYATLLKVGTDAWELAGDITT